MTLLTGLLFLALGFWFAVSPKSAFGFKAGLIKKLGGNLSGGKRMISAYRWIGVLLIAFGLILVF